MSSLRNAVKRITHKERAQPQSRQHLGILEKKKDYTVRAKDYHRKEDRINAIKQKGAMKNPDEFYFGMHNAQVKDGKHRKTIAAEKKLFEEEVGNDTVRIMKDQDLKYIRMQKQKDLKKVEKLRSSLHFLEAPSSKRKHTVFVESQSAAEDFDAASYFGTLPALVGRTFNRPKVEDLKKAALESAGFGRTSEENGEEHRPTREELTQRTREASKHAKKLSRAKDASYKEMAGREKRTVALSRAEAHLVTEKLVASKGRKRKTKSAENGEPAQYKWRRKRLT
jgi:U3 small nucleolar RNA-associated protein 11